MARIVTRRQKTRPASGAPVRGPEPGPAKGKGLIRSLARGFARTGKARPIEAATGHVREPAACKRCGAVFSRRVWRRDRAPSMALLDRVTWTTCPGCVQVKEETGYGRVRVLGAFAREHEDVIRRRVANVAARAARTEPERRIASIERAGDALEIITTSQKVAHRIVRELKKLYRGRARYEWSDDGTLFATWTRER